MKKILLTLLLIALPQCATTPPNPPSSASCDSACSNLARLGCPEGLEDNCSSVCAKAQAEKITDLRPDCLSGSATREEARACGTVTCQTP